MIDFHTHILPTMDDGSKNPEMSLGMIRRLAGQGVTDIVLTPHFYASQNSIEKFLARRDKSMKQLLSAAEGANMGVRLHPGAEVLFIDYIDRIEGIDEMTIGKTHYLLLEMPFIPWEKRYIDTVYKLMCNNITPIIAHFERYIPILGSMDYIYELKKLGCILQMNAESFNGFFKKARAVKFFADGTASLLGTDCHNLDSRPPEIKAARDGLLKKLGPKSLEEMDSLGGKILENSVFTAI